MENKITVTKTATMQVAANRVRLDVTAGGESKKYGAAADAADARAAGVVKAFNAIPQVTLRACGMDVRPMYSDGKTVGYKAARAFRCEFELDRELLSRVTDAVSALDVAWRISFSFKDGGEHTTLLGEAVRSARADARIIADAANVKLGALIGVEYAGSGGAMPVMLRAAHNMNEAEPESITLSESVVCTFEIN